MLLGGQCKHSLEFRVEVELPFMSQLRWYTEMRSGEVIKTSEQRTQLHPEKASTSRAREDELEPVEGTERVRWGRGTQRVALS